MRIVTQAEAEALVFPAQDPDTPASAKRLKAEVKRQVEEEKVKPHPVQSAPFRNVRANEEREEWPDPEEPE